MTMGLILLAITAIALFTSFGRRAFAGLGIPQWAAFMVVLAFAIGIVVPSIRIGKVYIGVAGFILPIVSAILIMVLLVQRGGVARGLVAMLAVVAVTTVLLLVMPMRTGGLRVLTAITIGVVGGAIAFIIGRTRAASAFAVLSGVAVGNLVYALIDYFAMNAAAITLGPSTVYNAVIVATMFALTVSEAAAMSGKSVDDYSYRRRAGSFEAGRDEDSNAYSENENYGGYDDEMF